MDNDTLLDKLYSLNTMNNDVLQIYDQIIDKLETPELHDQIVTFRDEHRRHVDAIMELIKSHAGQQPRNVMDIQGIFLGGAAAIQSMLGTEAALKALLKGEQLTNKKYRDAVEEGFSEDVLAVIKAHYADEQRHLEYISNAINDRIWKK